ncbi:hypothetical protein K7432_004338 [Basidiobolus ranarum]|uniref:C3H1-type domain-containing protein n=1 Tax=Basidiobolus ranarum TaxID=34480 RepID=A0ABR2WYC4_9FUNG
MALDNKKPPLCVYNDVTKENLLDSQNRIKDCFEHASFISLDTEFTGLGRGSSQNVRASNIQERYAALREVVTNHAMVAFGLSVFKEIDVTKHSPNPNPLEKSYTVDNFNFTLLCQNDYTVNPRSLSFLAESGFDFNKQALSGIPYFPGDVQETSKSNKFDATMRHIFRHLLASKAPVVLHNGLLDIMFLYHGFYASLPKKLDTFLADLSDMFPLGIYDTKYIADYLTREKASFLSYLYKKYEREQLKRKQNSRKHYLTISLNGTIVENPSTKTPVQPNNLPVKPCPQFTNHGYCPKGLQCPLSHDLDVILDAEMSRRKRKRKDGHLDEGIFSMQLFFEGNAVD